MDRVSINVLNHKIYRKTKNRHLHFKILNKELEQIDLFYQKKQPSLLRTLMWGRDIPESTEPTSLRFHCFRNQISFLTILQKNGSKFSTLRVQLHNTFGHYTFSPQQSDNETIIEPTANFKLFNHHFKFKVIYSLDTIERLLFYWEQLNKNIVEKTLKSTLKKTQLTQHALSDTTLTLNEIENLEIGDIVLLEEKKINSPFNCFEKDIIFNAQPVHLEENKLGVQIINSPIRKPKRGL